MKRKPAYVALCGAVCLCVLGVLSCGGARDVQKEPPPIPPIGPVLGQVAQVDLTYLTPEEQRQNNQLVINEPAGYQPDTVPIFFDQQGVRKTVLLANLINGLRAATEAYFADLTAACEQLVAETELDCTEEQGYYPDYTELSCEEFIQQLREYQRLRCLGNNELELDYNIAEGVAAMKALIQKFTAELAFVDGDAFVKELKLLEDILANMEQGGGPPPYRDEGMPPSPAPPGAWAGDAAGMAGPSAEGGLGVTPGGAQDIGYIRTAVEAGHVPLATHFAVEGLFSEHDLPLEARDCQQIFCVNAGLGFAQNWRLEQDRAFVQVGFSSSLTEATFKRRPLNLVVVLDVSGSMGDSALDSSKIAVVKTSLKMMVDKLNDRDQLAVVLFNNTASVLLQPTQVDDKQQLKDTISQIEAGGGTNIEVGLQTGFELAESHRSSHRMDRVMLLTDALPNVGATGQSSFLELAQQYGEQNIGLTTFGVGVNFGQELVVELSRVRGGNYFFLEDNDRIREVFERDFDLIVTPVAYDFQMTFRPADAYTISDVFGITSWENDGQQVELTVPTLFLSRNKGAILVELARKDS